MKKITSLFIVLCISLISCDEEEATPISVDLLLDRIEANAMLLDEAYLEAATLLESNQKIQKLLEGSKTKEQFINDMNVLVKSAFDKAIEKSRTSLMLGTASYPESDHSSTHFIKTILTTEKTKEDHIKTFSLEIEKELESKRQNEWIIIESYGPIQAAILPTEQLSMNYSEIEFMLDIFDLIVKHQDPEVLDKAIEDYIKASNPPPVPIALLLPAIQHIREASSSHGELLDLVFGDLADKTEKPGLIQNHRIAGFLGGLHLMISDAYRSDDENFASIGVLRQVYMVSLTEMWSQLWEYNQKKLNG
jgi:hypothetical protein